MKDNNEDNMLSLLPVSDYSKFFNWLIPVMIIISIVSGIYLTTKDVWSFSFINNHIIEKIVNKN